MRGSKKLLLEYLAASRSNQFTTQCVSRSRDTLTDTVLGSLYPAVDVWAPACVLFTACLRNSQVNKLLRVCEKRLLTFSSSTTSLKFIACKNLNQDFLTWRFHSPSPSAQPRQFPTESVYYCFLQHTVVKHISAYTSVLPTSKSFFTKFVWRLRSHSMHCWTRRSAGWTHGAIQMWRHGIFRIFLEFYFSRHACSVVLNCLEVLMKIKPGLQVVQFKSFIKLLPLPNVVIWFFFTIPGCSTRARPCHHCLLFLLFTSAYL